MDKEPSLCLSAIERLPVELLSLVLTHLPNLRSLQKATLSCPAFYRAFSGAMTVTITNLVLNKIEHDVLPEAVAALESSLLSLQPASARESLAEFANKHLRQRTEPKPSWNLNHAIHMEHLNTLVSVFAQKFTATALHKLANMSGIEVGPPTSSELCHIKRTLYRFETYWNIFRGHCKKDCSDEEQISPFFR